VNGETRIRTGDTTIFSRVLYQLSYLAAQQVMVQVTTRRGQLKPRI
jgi:precorrin-4 methylase